MPIVRDEIDLNVDRAINYAAPEIKDDISFKKKLTSAFRLENEIISFIAEEGGLPDGYASTEYDVFSKFTEEEKLDKRFIDAAVYADNDSELEAVRNQYQRELADRENIQGYDGVLAAILAGTLSPVNLIPVGGAATRAYKSGNVLKGGLSTAAVAAGTVTASEALLHESQLTRTGDESALNITGGALLGGALGGLVAKLNKNTLNKAAKEIETTFDGPEVTTRVGPDSVGAAQVFGDVRIKGKNVEKALSALKGIDPTARVMTADSQAARKYGAMLFENPLEVEGLKGRSVEQSARTKQQMYLGRAINVAHNEFKKLKESGSKIKYREFDEMVSREIRNPNSTGNEYAARAANAYSKEVFDTVLKEGQELKLWGDDMDVVTAKRYLNRRWNKEAVAGNIKEFERVIEDWIKRTDPSVESPDELASDIALRIMGTPDGMIPYDAVIREGVEGVSEAPNLNKLKGLQVSEKVYVKETGEFKKVKGDAFEVHGRLTKQRKMVDVLRGCLNA
jgi:hypothetical protein